MTSPETYNPYADTFCPYCGAAEPDWNGAHADPAWHSDDVTDEMVTAAMREFEKWTPLLRYKEADGWHANDRMGMREAIRAALAA